MREREREGERVEGERETERGRGRERERGRKRGRDRERERNRNRKYNQLSFKPSFEKHTRQEMIWTFSSSCCSSLEILDKQKITLFTIFTESELISADI